MKLRTKIDLAIVLGICMLLLGGCVEMRDREAHDWKKWWQERRNDHVPRASGQDADLHLRIDEYLGGIGVGDPLRMACTIKNNLAETVSLNKHQFGLLIYEESGDPVLSIMGEFSPADPGPEDFLQLSGKSSSSLILEFYENSLYSFVYKDGTVRGTLRAGKYDCVLVYLQYELGESYKDSDGQWKKRPDYWKGETVYSERSSFIAEPVIASITLFRGDSSVMARSVDFYGHPFEVNCRTATGRYVADEGYWKFEDGEVKLSLDSGYGFPGLIHFDEEARWLEPTLSFKPGHATVLVRFGTPDAPSLLLRSTALAVDKENSDALILKDVDICVVPSAKSSPVRVVATKREFRLTRTEICGQLKDSQGKREGARKVIRVFN